MNVLSLFDGMSCGQLAFQRAGIHVDKYFASEIEKPSILVTQKNFPNTIQLGDVRNVTQSMVDKIDILIGGSPCQSFSFAGKLKGMSTTTNIQVKTLNQYLELKESGFEFVGQSYLFWEYVRLLRETKPKYFFLENVIMPKKWESVITNELGVSPVEINSSLVSAQSRRRLYWTNIGLEKFGLFDFEKSSIKKPIDKNMKLCDIVEGEVNEKYFLSQRRIDKIFEHKKRQIERKTGFMAKFYQLDEKMGTLTVGSGGHSDLIFIGIESFEGKSCSFRGRNEYDDLTKTFEKIEFRVDKKSNALTTNYKNMLVVKTGKIRCLTPVEYERLQTVPDGYTSAASETARYKMLGNGWTIDVIAHFFKHIKT